MLLEDTTTHLRMHGHDANLITFSAFDGRRYDFFYLYWHMVPLWTEFSDVFIFSYQ